MADGSKEKAIVLVTGASGFLGGRLCEILVNEGYRLKAFVRKTSRWAKLEMIGADICYGDINDGKSLKCAMADVEVVIHAAADTSGNDGTGQDTTVQGTKNVLAAAMARGLKQLIYISSCSVYGVSDCRPCQTIDEDGPLEREPEQRGQYSNAKFKAEKIVLEAIHNEALKITCLRPGTIWGPGGEAFTPMIGVKIGRHIIGMFGNGKSILPLIYVDNLVDAIVKCIGHPSAAGKVYNVVDDYQIDKNTYVEQILKPLFPQIFILKIPYWGLYSAVAFQEMACKLMRRKPFLTRYRLVSSQRCVVYDSGKIKRELNWGPVMDFRDGVRKVIEYETLEPRPEN